MAISKKEKNGEKRKGRKRFVSPLVEKMMKREVAMPPTRKEDAMKGVNSTYAIHMHSLGLGL